MTGSVEARDSGGRLVGSVVLDPAGRYAMRLPVGSYTLHATGGGTFLRCPDIPVTVEAGPPAIANITCDTGIR